MQSIDLDILRYCSERSQYYELKDTINKGLCIKESWELLADFGVWFEENKGEACITEDFILWQRIKRHPGWKPDEARIKASIVSNVLSLAPPNRATFLDSIHHIRATGQYRAIADDLERGTITTADAEVRVRSLSTTQHGNDTLIKLDLNTISAMASTGGLYWRCEDLNQSIGPLNKGDFILVVKRPEVGGTSFLVSEMTYMLEQTNGNAILFNNEEAPAKVYSRMVSAALDVDYRKLLGDATKYQAAYDKWLNGSHFDLVHDTQMTISSVHKALEERDYDLIGINVLLKIGGTGAEADHDKFQALGEECRRISQAYGPVIAIAQADPSAEGLQYIPQDRIYKSKTALQGEADGMIMIGTGDETVAADDVRFLYVAKNKIPPHKCSDITKKHIKCQVKFDMGTGRFTSTNHTTNSRLLA